MVENLKEIVKNILEDEKEVKEFGELKTLEEVYERCKDLGYKSDY